MNTQNQQHNSNAAQKRQAIVKTILLMLLLMAFAGLGVSLIHQTDKVDAIELEQMQAEVKTLKEQTNDFQEEREAFLEQVTEINSAWMTYKEAAHQLFSPTDTLDATRIPNKLKKLTSAFQNRLDSVKSAFRDSVHQTAISTYQLLVDELDESLKYRNELQESLQDKRSEEELRTEIWSLEEQVHDLRRRELERTRSNSGSGNAALEKNIIRLETENTECLQSLRNKEKARLNAQQESANLRAASYILLSDIKAKLESIELAGLCFSSNRKESSQKLDSIVSKLESEIEHLKRP